MRAIRVSFVGAGMAVVFAGAAQGEAVIIDLSPVAIPNFVGIGIGGAPDYLGSDDLMAGGFAFGRYTWGNRYVSLQGNFASANVIDHPNWRFGPSATLRFGRDDVDDPVVDLLPDIDHSLDLGAFVSYEIVSARDPRNRWSFEADFAHDVTGEHSGFAVSAAARRWFPVGDFAALGLAVSSTYGSEDYMDTYFSVTPAGALASGLPAFSADAGFRDVRLTAVFIQPLSKQWVVGGGLMYMRLLEDAANTPITDARGSPNQFVFGLGVAHIF